MKNRRSSFSFRCMFCVTLAVVIFLSSATGPDKITSLCVNLAIPCANKENKNIQSSGGLLKSVAKKETADTDKKITETARASSNLAYVPSDIQKLIDAARSKESSDVKDGAIVEHTYDKTSATDSYGDILVRNASERSIDIESVLKQSPDLNIKDKSKPTVLIFHTHTTESYQILDRDFYAVGFTSRNMNPSENMVRVGTEIAAQIESAGYKVIHDTKIYDEKYNGAYDRSGAGIDEYLKKYPDIQVILDIHRDAIQDNSGTKTKPVNKINGKKAAQLMIISGCEGDGLDGFPDWQYNLRFAMKLQKKCVELYPGLARPLLFDERRYNMYKGHCSLLIEIGSDSNTLDEAVYTGRLLGKVLSETMKDYTK